MTVDRGLFVRRRLLIALVCLVGVARPSAAATINVTSLQQHEPDACTLANAIRSANADLAIGGCEAGSGIDVIRVPAGIYLLTEPETGVSAFPEILTPMVIEGAGRDLTIIRRHADADPFRFFYVMASLPFVIAPSLELRQLTLSGGRAPGLTNGGAVLTEDWPVTARHARFENNEAVFGGAVADVGYFGTQGARVVIEESEFVANRVSNGGGAIRVSPGGALTVRDSRFSGNDAYWGAAIYVAASTQVTTSVEVTDTEIAANTSVEGALHVSSPRLTRVTLRDNLASGRGGALYSYGGRPIIVDSTFSGNRAREGGAAWVLGSVEVSGSTFNDNAAVPQLDEPEISLGGGGALWLDERPRTSRVINSTFSGNRSMRRGAAITLEDGTLTLINSTVVFNRNEPRDWTAGIAPNFGNATELRLSNSIVAHNSYVYQDVTYALDLHFDGAAGHIVSLGHNLIGTDALTTGAFVEPGDQAGTEEQPRDPGVLPLAANGGSTTTHALAPGSLALDAGSAAAPGAAGACETVDQRGVARPGAGTPRCDIGAFEHQVVRTVSVTVGAGGTVTGLGDTPCAGSCTLDIPSGAVVTLTATAAIGFAFESWSGACTATNPVCTLTVDADVSATATFSSAPVGLVPTTMVLTANQANSGTSVTLTAAVTASGSAAMPVGSVEFLEVVGARALGTAALNEAGIASLTVEDLAPGQYEIRAQYLGNPQFEPSSASVSTTVTPPPPAILNIVEAILVADGVTLLPAAMLAVVESVLVADTVGLLPAAMLSLIEAITVSDTPGMIAENTPTGSPVIVYPADPVVIEFAVVTTGGNTTAIAQPGPPPPAGFEQTLPPVGVDISTTATFTGFVRVCLAFPPATVNPRLMHFEGGGWVDRTIAGSAVADRVCGLVDSLSPFAVFVPVAREGRMEGHGELQVDIDFEFQISERSIGDERGSLKLTRKTPKSGRQKARTDKFRATSIGEIVFWDGPGLQPARRRHASVDSAVFIGTGIWNGDAGYTFEVEATDAGEPGRQRDSFSITIRDPHGAIVLSADGLLTDGNIQSQRLRQR